MNPAMATAAFKWGGIVLCGVALHVTAREVARTGWYPGRDEVRRYVTFVDRIVRASALRVSARRIVAAQALALGATMVLTCLSGEPRLLTAAGAAALLPVIYLLKVERKRIAACDKQASGFTLALANALKTVPNIGSALEGILPVLRDPIRGEISLALAEVAVGSSVDAALLHASVRARSKPFDACIAALLVGRQVGGNLPVVLETTAETLREMDRLEGVVQTRTAEGRAQLMVLLVLPAVVAVAFSVASPGYFDPLKDQMAGRIVLMVVGVLWVTSILIARSIMAVDL